MSGGPATSYQQSGDWSLQDSSPADSRTGGQKDCYLSRLEDWKDLTLDSELKLLAAWWPLSRGAGGYGTPASSKKSDLVTIRVT